VNRDKIAAALAGITYKGRELDPHEVEPQTYSAMQAWPVWVETRWLTRCTVEHDWHVFVLLPGGDPEAWFDAAAELLQPVREALEVVGHVLRAEPVALAAQNITNTMPALRYVITTAEGA
jgi:hypothetical protein